MAKRKETAGKKHNGRLWPCWRPIALLAAVVLLFAVWERCAMAAGPEAEEGVNREVLIVCRRAADAAFLQTMAAAFGRNTTTVTEEAYEEGMVNRYSAVLTTSPVCVEELKSRGIPGLCLKEACLRPDIAVGTAETADVGLALGQWSEHAALEKNFLYLKENGDDGMGSLLIAKRDKTPFLLQKGGLFFAPFYREKGLGAVMVGNAMARLFEETGAGRLYFAIDRVYPFSDLNLLCRMADLLYENGIPFAVRVMPVYDNLDYPAFTRYAQVLRYIQAKNGTVLIHPPIVRQDEPETEPLSVRMERFTQALKREKVFYVESAFSPYLLTWEELLNIFSSTKDFGVFAFPAMFAVSADMEWEDFERFVVQVNGKWLALSDLKSEYTGEKFRYAEEPAEVGFSEVEEYQAGFQGFFDRGDKILLVVVGAGLAVFMALIVIGARWYRRKFMKQ